MLNIKTTEICRNKLVIDVLYSILIINYSLDKVVRHGATAGKVIHFE